MQEARAQGAPPWCEHTVFFPFLGFMSSSGIVGQKQYRNDRWFLFISSKQRENVSEITLSAALCALMDCDAQ